MSIDRQPQPGAQRGVTLIELVIFIVIVGVAVAGLVAVLNLSNANSVDPQLRKQALAIAEGMLEEIELARFTFCDPTDPGAETATGPGDCTVQEAMGQESGGVGRPFDNVNDYVKDYVNAVPYQTQTDAAGNPYPDGYSALVTLTADAGLGPPGAQLAPADTTPVNLRVLRINVTVSYPGNKKLSLDGYRTRYAPSSIP